MAHKKGGGSTRNGRDSNAQYRGIKRFGGEAVNAGTIIVRQCGMTFAPGNNVALAKDFTLYAKVNGTVSFGWVNKRKQKVSVIPAA